MIIIIFAIILVGGAALDAVFQSGLPPVWDLLIAAGIGLGIMTLVQSMGGQKASEDASTPPDSDPDAKVE